MSDPYFAAISKLRQDLENQIFAVKEDPKMAEVLRLHSALNVMEDLLNQPKTSLSELFGLEQGFSIHPGEFYGLSPLQAAKRFLRKKGKAASFKEIIEAIRTGGVIIDSEDKFRVSLGRSTTDIVKIDAEHYGLLEFYPARRERKKKTVSEGGQSEDVETDEDSTDEDSEETESPETLQTTQLEENSENDEEALPLT